MLDIRLASEHISDQGLCELSAAPFLRKGSPRPPRKTPSAIAWPAGRRVLHCPARGNPLAGALPGSQRRASPPRTLGFTSPMPREKVCAYSGDWHIRGDEPLPYAEAPLPFAVSHAIAVPFMMVFGNRVVWIMPLFDRGTRLVCVEAQIRGCIGRIPRHLPGSANSALCGACPRRGRQSEWGS